jgi:hypothetical protein
VNRGEHKPACWHNSAMIIAAPGSRSEGLRMSVFPVTAAMGMDHRGIILTEDVSGVPKDMGDDVRRKVEWGYACADTER